MTSVKLSKLTAVILSVVLMLSLVVVPAFAEAALGMVAGAAENEDAEDGIAYVAASAETDAETDAQTEAATDAQTEAETDAEAKAADDDEEESSFNWDLWISVGIIALAVVVFFGFFAFSAKFRERVKKFFREYKSELSKVVWSPLSDVKKNTLVVLVISLGAAILIGILDFVFSKGIIALGSLIG